MINIRLAVHPLLQTREIVPSYGGFNRGVTSPVVALCTVRDAILSSRGNDTVSVSLTNYTTSLVLDQVAATVAAKFFEALDIRTSFLVVFGEDSLSDVVKRPEFAGTPAAYVLSSDAFTADVEEVSGSDVAAFNLGTPVRIYAIASSSKHVEALVASSAARAKHAF